MAERLVQVIKIGNATVEIYRPELTPEERARREETIRAAMRSFARETGGKVCETL